MSMLLRRYHANRTPNTDAVEPVDVVVEPTAVEPEEVADEEDSEGKKKRKK